MGKYTGTPQDKKNIMMRQQLCLHNFFQNKQYANWENKCKIWPFTAQTRIIYLNIFRHRLYLPCLHASDPLCLEYTAFCSSSSYKIRSGKHRNSLHSSFILWLEDKTDHYGLNECSPALSISLYLCRVETHDVRSQIRIFYSLFAIYGYH